jgi:Tetratricopeptide repeat
MPSVSELQQRAIDLARSGDFGAEALATNLELARAAPANEGAWTRISRCHLEGGRLDEATAALDTVLELNPGNSIARSLQTEVARRRVASAAPISAPRARAARAVVRAPRAPARTRKSAAVTGFGRAEFGSLAQLTPEAAVEALGARIEALLMALNERDFASRAVETRNRAGLSGARLFRRNTIQAASPGHVRVFHQGGRGEPQLSVGFFASIPWGRDAISAGLAFDVSPTASIPEQERALAAFAQFQQLIAGAWHGFLSQWMAASGGFIQYGGPPATDLLPDAALRRLIDCPDPREAGFLFIGRWLFADRPQDAEILADGRKLVAWTVSSFSDLLPIWTTMYRG